jgi:hypothetical protein
MMPTELAQDLRAPIPAPPFPLDVGFLRPNRRAPGLERGRLRVGVISNMRAGRRGPHVDRVVSFLRNHSDVPRYETDDSGNVAEALRDLARREVGVLVVNGGDGSLQRTLTELLGNETVERLPLIAPLRSGRTNMSALDLGADPDPVAAVAGIMEAARSGSMQERVVDRPVLRVRVMPEGVTHYGMFFGAGVIERAIGFIHRAFPEGRAQGDLGAGIVTGALVARAVLGSAKDLLTPDPAQVRLDGGAPFRGEFQLLMASTLDRLFWGLRPFWGQQQAPVRFTSITHGAVGGPLPALRILRGKRPTMSPESEGLCSRNVEQIEIKLDCGLTVDGEVMAPRPGRAVRVEADRRIRFVRG